MSGTRQKRFYVTLPERLLARLDDFIDPSERNDLIHDLLEEYVVTLEAEEEHVARVEARRERMQLIVTNLRKSGRKAAEIFLP